MQPLFDAQGKGKGLVQRLGEDAHHLATLRSMPANQDDEPGLPPVSSCQDGGIPNRRRIIGFGCHKQDWSCLREVEAATGW